MIRGEVGFHPFPFGPPHGTRPPIRMYLVQSPRMEPMLGPPLGSFPLGLINQLHTLPFQERVGPAAGRVTTLSPDGGWRRIVRWGDLRHLLQTEIAHPERLRESHRLTCSVEVHEAVAFMSRGDVEAELERDDDRAVRLEPLTRELELRLGLASVLPGPNRLRRDPHRRFVELHVLEDPTARSQPGVLPHRGQADQTGATAIAAPPRRTSIPSQWMRPWEFRLSRDEAAYDMQASRRPWARFRSAIRRVVRFAATRAAMEKWKALLTGKPIDEQLWGIRPPAEAYTHERARGWLAKALTAAGYDPAVMLAEWEIFWRRKGVQAW